MNTNTKEQRWQDLYSQHPWSPLLIGPEHTFWLQPDFNQILISVFYLQEHGDAASVSLLNLEPHDDILEVRQTIPVFTSDKISMPWLIVRPTAKTIGLLQHPLTLIIQWRPIILLSVWQIVWYNINVDYRSVYMSLLPSVPSRRAQRRRDARVPPSRTCPARTTSRAWRCGSWRRFLPATSSTFQAAVRNGSWWSASIVSTERTNSTEDPVRLNVTHYKAS